MRGLRRGTHVVCGFPSVAAAVRHRLTVLSAIFFSAATDLVTAVIYCCGREQ